MPIRAAAAWGPCCVCAASPEAVSAPDEAGAGSGRNLPAAYEDPLRALGRDLRALVASLRLRLRELWRRNREGDLSVPGFWPDELAPLFWPLLLALGLALLLALPRTLGRMLPAQRRAPAAAVPQRLVTAPLPRARTTAVPEPVPEAVLPAPAALAGDVSADPAAGPAAAAPDPGPESFPEAAAPAPAQPLAIDPLLALLAEDDPRHLIGSAHPDPAADRLVIRLAPAFALLGGSERVAEANRWLARSQALGYERLELVDGAGRLLGRQALVGSGMILLAPAAAP